MKLSAWAKFACLQCHKFQADKCTSVLENDVMTVFATTNSSWILWGTVEPLKVAFTQVWSARWFPDHSPVVDQLYVTVLFNPKLPHDDVVNAACRVCPCICLITSGKSKIIIRLNYFQHIYQLYWTQIHSSPRISYHMVHSRIIGTLHEKYITI